MLSLWIVGLRIGLLAVLNLGTGSGQNQAGPEQLAAFEKEIGERPLEGLSIARRASSLFGKDERRLYKLAADQQEKNLALLGVGQIAELAEVFEKKLDDFQGGRRIRIAWLEQRGIGLTQEQVHQLLGSPQRVTSEILYRRQIDQWVYHEPAMLWIIFSYTKGQVVRVQAMHSASSNP
jgi:hypothetical protein